MVKKNVIAIFGSGIAESLIALHLHRKAFRVIILQPSPVPALVCRNSFVETIHLDSKYIADTLSVRPDPILIDTYKDDFSRAIDAIISNHHIPFLTWQDPWQEFIISKKDIITLITNPEFEEYISEISGLKIAIGLSRFYGSRYNYDLIIGGVEDDKFSEVFLPGELTSDSCHDYSEIIKEVKSPAAGIWNYAKIGEERITKGDVIGSIDSKQIQHTDVDAIIIQAQASGNVIDRGEPIFWYKPTSGEKQYDDCALHKSIAYEIERFLI